MAVFRWGMFLAGAVLLVVMIVTTGAGQLYEDVIRQGWAIVPYLAMTFVENCFHTLSVRKCFSREHRRAIPFWRLFLVYQICYSINHVTPTVEVGGDVVKGLVIEKYVPGAEAASATVINKFAYSIGRMGAAGLLTGLTVLCFQVHGLDAWLLGLGGGLTTAALLLFAYFQARGLFGTALARLAWVTGRRSQEWVRANVGELDQRLRAYYRDHWGDLYRAILWDLIGFAVGIAQRWYLMCLLLRDVHGLAPVTLLVAAAVWGVSSLINLIFFFVAAQLGVQEEGYKIAFEAVGLPGEKGVALSVVDRIDQLFWVAVGIVAYGFEMKAKRRSAAEAAEAGASTDASRG